jgi:hypothetical protein
MVTGGGLPPGGQDLSTVRLRGRTRWLQLMAAPAGIGLVVAAIVYWTDPEFGPMAALLAFAAGLFFLAIGVRGPQRGIDADRDGVLIRNMFTSRRVPWADLDDVTFDAVQNEGGGTSYHRLVIHTGGESVPAQAPGGRPDPGGRLDRARTLILAMRDEAVAERP